MACSYGYKLVCVDDKFSKNFKSYLGKDSVYNFNNSMIKESNYCSHVIKKHFNKELVISKKDDKTLRTLVNAEIVIIFMFMTMLK